VFFREARHQEYEGAGGADAGECPQSRDASAGPAVQLDNYGRNPTLNNKRRRGRLYHRVRSFMAICRGSGRKVLWMTLTTATGGRADRMAYDVQRLMQAIEQNLKFRNLVHLMVQTAEGNGVAHLLVGWKPGGGERPREFWIPLKTWLKPRWKAIHGADQADVRSLHSGGVAKYLLSQYVMGQEALVRVSWSWRRLYQFPLVKVWRWWIRDVYGFGRLREAICAWESMLLDRAPPGVLTLGFIRELWRTWRPLRFRQTEDWRPSIVTLG
jgi:hypothetical protein